jgi:hypothetical protein
VKLGDDVRGCLANAGKFGEALLRDDLSSGSTRAARLSAVRIGLGPIGIAAAQRRTLDVLPKQIAHRRASTFGMDPR